MRRLLVVASTLLCCGVLAAAIGLYGCGSGGGGGGSEAVEATPTGKLTLSFTDAPADDLTAVVITVDKLVLKEKTEEEAAARAGAAEATEDDEVADVVVDFEPNVEINLLELGGAATFPILQGEEVPAAVYGWAKAVVVTDECYVMKAGERFPLLVNQQYQGEAAIKIILKEGITVPEGGEVDLTVDFDLRSSVFFVNGEYLFKTVCRIADTQGSGHISGTVEDGRLTGSNCQGYVYVFPGKEVTTDDYDKSDMEYEMEDSHPGEPLTSAKVDEDGKFTIGFLPAGDYSLAFTCNGDQDVPEQNDSVVFETFEEVTVAAGGSTDVTISASGGKPGEESAGNNLSYPVIWAEGVTKVLRGTAGMEPVLDGGWWYQWGTNGTDPDVVPASCAPDPDEGDATLNPEGLPYCNDGVPGSLSTEHLAGQPVADAPLPLAKAYLQKDELNTWQAQAGTPSEMGVAGAEGEVVVNLIDWGDNLESVDWYTRSQVRTEVVMFQQNPASESPWLEYGMRHTSGWGIDEVHGLAEVVDPLGLELGPGTQGTVYSHCARLTIQKLLVDRDDPSLATLVWMPAAGNDGGYWQGEGLINPPLFNLPVWQGGDGPGYYSAEINVKGRIIYGYTWNVARMNDLTGDPPTAAGDYRLTFSLDETCGSVAVARNAFFEEGLTEILVPIEEEVVELAAEDEGDGGTGEEPGGGGAAVLDCTNDLTYIDIHILERGGGGTDDHGGGGGGPPDGKGGPPDGTGGGGGPPEGKGPGAEHGE